MFIEVLRMAETVLMISDVTLSMCFCYSFKLPCLDIFSRAAKTHMGFESLIILFGLTCFLVKALKSIIFIPIVCHSYSSIHTKAFSFLFASLPTVYQIFYVNISQTLV